MSFWSDRNLLEAGGNAGELLSKIARITTWSTECEFLWRGNRDEAWPLHSGLFDRLRIHSGHPPTEGELRTVETDLLRRAERSGYGGARGTPDLQRLAILQHHGTATRFLDVTPDPMVALWFACDDTGPTVARGILFAIEVSGAEHLDWTDERPIDKVVDSLKKNQLAVYTPAPTDARIQVQRGVFVFGKTPDDKSMREATSVPIQLRGWTAEKRKAVFGKRSRGRPPVPSILALRVPQDTKHRLLTILERSYGYTAETIFPDIDGFSAANGRTSRFR
jgi:hypothetical protein